MTLALGCSGLLGVGCSGLPPPALGRGCISRNSDLLGLGWLDFTGFKAPCVRAYLRMCRGVHPVLDHCLGRQASKVSPPAEKQYL